MEPIQNISDPRSHPMMNTQTARMLARYKAWLEYFF